MKGLLVRVAVISLLAIPLSAGPAAADQEFSTTAVAVADTNVAPAGQPQLLAVTVGHHEGFDRVVFQFSSHVPGYNVGYVDQIRADGSDLPIAVKGSAFIHVAFSSVASAQVGAPAAPQGSHKPGFDELREVVGAGDFEGVVSFGIGLAVKSGFRVSPLTSPDRVVIDIQTPTLAATGSASRPLLLGGVLVLSVGIGLVAIARRRKHELNATEN